MSLSEPNAIPPDARPRLAHLLAPLRVELSETPLGCQLRLEPMPLEHALDALAEQRPSAASEMLLLSGPPDPDGEPDLPRLTEHDDEAAPPPADAAPLVTDVEGWSDLTQLLPQGDLAAVMIDGPIESADADAIDRARQADTSPLAAELRATIAIHVSRDGVLTVDARRRADAVAFVAESLRRYVAQLLRRSDLAETARPETALIDRLLDRTGFMQVRPIETEVFSTAVDVGVLTQPTHQPADTSLIYDIFGNTWHGE